MIEVRPISSKRDRERFVRFKNRLYRGNKYAVPTLESGELKTLDPEQNPAMDFCELQCFLAYRGGQIVGRICAIINHKANETWGKKEGRFGFFDFIEDIEVAKALISSAEEWIRSKGMDSMHGPLGITNMDQGGMLIEGFEELGTKATLYNYPYYPEYMERMGFTKAADWIEMVMTVPEEIPSRVVKFASIIEKKNDLKVLRFKSTKEIIEKGWAERIFALINKEYAKLYGYNSMTQRQIDHYAKMYIPMVRLELLCLIADRDDNLVGVGIALPSLSRALQRAKGRMLPFGWYHLLRALKSKRSEIIDLMLIAIDEAYQNKGLTAIIINEVLGGMKAMGAKYVESNPELETNTTMQNQWDMFERREHKRRRVFTRPL